MAGSGEPSGGPVAEGLSYDLTSRAQWASLDSVVHVGARFARYCWLDDAQFLFPSPIRFTVAFEANAPGDIHVCFVSDPKRVTFDGRPTEGGTEHYPEYEFNIGGYMNTRTSLRRFGKQQVAVTKGQFPGAMVTKHQFDKYWICFDLGHLSLGRGDTSDNVLLQYEDPHPLPVNVLGLSSWDKPILYRSIEIRPLMFSMSHEPNYSPVRNAQWNMGLDFSRLLFSEHLADIRFYVEDTLIFAHRLILMGWGKALADLYNGADSSGIKVVHGLSPSALQVVLKFLYTGILEMGQMSSGDAKNVQEWMDAAGLKEASRPSYVRFYQTEELADVLFVVEGERIPAHRCLLAGVATPFYSMFTVGMRESFEREIVLPETGILEFRLLLQYAYTHELRLECVEDTIGVLTLAERFGMSTLKARCASFLQSRVGEEGTDALALMRVAELFHCTALRKACIGHIMRHFEDMCKADMLLGLDPITMSEIVRSEHLFAKSEMAVFEAVVHWATLRSGEDDNSSLLDKDTAVYRMQDFEAVLEWIRFPLMPKDFLMSLCTTPLYSRCNQLQVLVQEALSSGGPRFGSRSKDVVVDGDHIVVTRENSQETRLRRRTPTAWKVFPFSHAGDENGVCFFAGTNSGRSTKWTNPHVSKNLEVEFSGPRTKYTAPERLVNRQFNSTSYVAGTSVKPPWVLLDLGESRLLMCNHYTLRHDGGDEYLRNWRLQGSGDKCVWEDLRVHEDDHALHFPGQFGSWPVEGEAAEVPRRYFRIILDAPSSPGSRRWHLCISQFEFYGYFFTSETT